MSLDLLELATGGDGTLLRFFLGFLLTGPWFSSSCLLGIFLTFWPFGTGNGKGTVRCYCGSVWLDHDLCRHVCLGLVGLATRWDCTLRILGLFSAYFFFGFGTLFLFKGFCDFYFWKEKRQGFLTQTWGLGYMGLLASTLVHQVQSLWVCYLKSLIFWGFLTPSWALGYEKFSWSWVSRSFLLWFLVRVFLVLYMYNPSGKLYFGFGFCKVLYYI